MPAFTMHCFLGYMSSQQINNTYHIACRLVGTLKHNWLKM